MASSINIRQKSFENNFVLQEEIDFKAKVMASKLLGLWATREMHLNQVKTQEYVKHLIELSINSNSQEQIIDHIHKSLEQKGLNYTKHRVESLFSEHLNECRAQLIK